MNKSIITMSSNIGEINTLKNECSIQYSEITTNYHTVVSFTKHMVSRQGQLY